MNSKHNNQPLELHDEVPLNIDSTESVMVVLALTLFDVKFKIKGATPSAISDFIGFWKEMEVVEGYTTSKLKTVALINGDFVLKGLKLGEKMARKEMEGEVFRCILAEYARLMHQFKYRGEQVEFANWQIRFVAGVGFLLGHDLLDKTAELLCKTFIVNMIEGFELPFPLITSGEEGTHAQIVSFSREGAEYGIKIYNSGFGIDNHYSVEKPSGEILYSPFLAFHKIHVDTLLYSVFFHRFLRIGGKLRISDQDLYMGITAMFSTKGHRWTEGDYLKHSQKIEKNPSVQAKLIKAQRSGTCTAGAIKAFLYTNLPLSLYIPMNRFVKIDRALASIKAHSSLWLEQNKFKHDAFYLIFSILRNIARRLEKVTQHGGLDDVELYKFARDMVGEDREKYVGIVVECATNLLKAAKEKRHQAVEKVDFSLRALQMGTKDATMNAHSAIIKEAINLSEPLPILTEASLDIKDVRNYVDQVRKIVSMGILDDRFAKVFFTRAIGRLSPHFVHPSLAKDCLNLRLEIIEILQSIADGFKESFNCDYGGLSYAGFFWDYFRLQNVVYQFATYSEELYMHPQKEKPLHPLKLFGPSPSLMLENSISLDDELVQFLTKEYNFKSSSIHITTEYNSNARGYYHESMRNWQMRAFPSVKIDNVNRPFDPQLLMTGHSMNAHASPLYAEFYYVRMFESFAILSRLGEPHAFDFRDHGEGYLSHPKSGHSFTQTSNPVDPYGQGDLNLQSDPPDATTSPFYCVSLFPIKLSSMLVAQEYLVNHSLTSEATYYFLSTTRLHPHRILASTLRSDYWYSTILGRFGIADINAPESASNFLKYSTLGQSNPIDLGSLKSYISQNLKKSIDAILDHLQKTPAKDVMPLVKYLTIIIHLDKQQAIQETSTKPLWETLWYLRAVGDRLRDSVEMGLISGTTDSLGSIKALELACLRAFLYIHHLKVTSGRFIMNEIEKELLEYLKVSYEFSKLKPSRLVCDDYLLYYASLGYDDLIRTASLYRKIVNQEVLIEMVQIAAGEIKVTKVDCSNFPVIRYNGDKYVSMIFKTVAVREQTDFLDLSQMNGATLELENREGTFHGNLNTYRVEVHGETFFGLEKDYGRDFIIAFNDSNGIMIERKIRTMLLKWRIQDQVVLHHNLLISPKIKPLTLCKENHSQLISSHFKYLRHMNALSLSHQKDTYYFIWDTYAVDISKERQMILLHSQGKLFLYSPHSASLQFAQLKIHEAPDLEKFPALCREGAEDCKLLIPGLWRSKLYLIPLRKRKSLTYELYPESNLSILNIVYRLIRSLHYDLAIKFVQQLDLSSKFGDTELEILGSLILYPKLNKTSNPELTWMALSLAHQALRHLQDEDIKLECRSLKKKDTLKCFVSGSSRRRFDKGEDITLKDLTASLYRSYLDQRNNMDEELAKRAYLDLRSNIGLANSSWWKDVAEGFVSNSYGLASKLKGIEISNLPSGLPKKKALTDRPPSVTNYTSKGAAEYVLKAKVLTGCTTIESSEFFYPNQNGAIIGACDHPLVSNEFVADLYFTIRAQKGNIAPFQCDWLLNRLKDDTENKSSEFHPPKDVILLPAVLPGPHELLTLKISNYWKLMIQVALLSFEKKQERGYIGVCDKLRLLKEDCDNGIEKLNELSSGLLRNKAAIEAIPRVLQETLTTLKESIESERDPCLKDSVHEVKLIGRSFETWKLFKVDSIEDLIESVKPCIARNDLQCVREKLKCPSLKHSFLDLLLQYVQISFINKYHEKRIQGRDACDLYSELSSANQDGAALQGGFLTWQYTNGYALSKRQVEDVLKATNLKNGSYPEIILQRVMASGKTFTLGPLITMGKADGEHLPVLIVPASLFETNSSDLLRRQMHFFGQRGMALRFERMQNFRDHQYLLDLLGSLISMINERGFVVTAPESIQAMENSFIEMLRPETKCPQLTLDAMRMILKLFKYRGAATFDEIDLIFDPVKELNFPMGNPEEFDPVYVYLSALLQYVEIFDKKSDPEDVLAAYISRSGEAPWSAIDGKATLDEQYLSDKDQSTQPSSNIDINLIMWQQLHQWLPQGRKYSVNLHFGRSVKNSKLWLAKPFKSAKVPSEDSEFANPYETLNKTFKMYFTHGIGEDQCRDLLWHLLGHLKNRVGEIKQVFGLSSLSNLETYKDVTKSFNKALLDPEAENHKFAVEYLLNYIVNVSVPNDLRYFRSSIKSNALSMASRFKSIMGYSGTLPNDFIFPESLRAGMQLDKGAIGQIIVILLEQRNKLVRKADGAKDLAQLVASIAGPYQEGKRALIDIGALFRDFSNEEVADELKRQWKADAVLFFDSKTNRIVALEDGRTISISRSDEKGIQDTLGSNSRYVIFFDQWHTTGTDIFLQNEAHAVATVGKETTLRDLTQGVMRMRKFLSRQSVELVLEEEVWLHLGGDTTMASVLEYTQANSIERKKRENLQVSFAKVSQAARTVVLDHLLDQTLLSVSQANSLYDCKLLISFEPILRDLYGGVMKRTEVVALLKSTMAEKLKLIHDDLLKVQAQVEMEMILAEIESLLRSGMIEKEIKVKGELLDTGSSLEQQRMELADEGLMDQTKVDPAGNPLGLEPNLAMTIGAKGFYLQNYIQMLSGQATSSFSEAACKKYPQINFDFIDKQIEVSADFVHSSQGNDGSFLVNLWDSRQKPFEVLLLVTEYSGAKRLIICTGRDALGIIKVVKHIDRPAFKKIYVTDLSGTIFFGGKAGVKCDDPDFDQLLAEVWMLAGYYPLIRDAKLSDWSKEKLGHYFGLLMKLSLRGGHRTAFLADKNTVSKFPSSGQLPSSKSSKPNLVLAGQLQERIGELDKMVEGSRDLNWDKIASSLQLLHEKATQESDENLVKDYLKLKLYVQFLKAFEMKQAFAENLLNAEEFVPYLTEFTKLFSFEDKGHLAELVLREEMENARRRKELIAMWEVLEARELKKEKLLKPKREEMELRKREELKAKEREELERLRKENEEKAQRDKAEAERKEEEDRKRAEQEELERIERDKNPFGPTPSNQFVFSDSFSNPFSSPFGDAPTTTYFGTPTEYSFDSEPWNPWGDTAQSENIQEPDKSEDR